MCTGTTPLMPVCPCSPPASIRACSTAGSLSEPTSDLSDMKTRPGGAAFLSPPRGHALTPAAASSCWAWLVVLLVACCPATHAMMANTRACTSSVLRRAAKGGVHESHRFHGVSLTHLHACMVCLSIASEVVGCSLQPSRRAAPVCWSAVHLANACRVQWL